MGKSEHQAICHDETEVQQHQITVTFAASASTTN